MIEVAQQAYPTTGGLSTPDLLVVLTIVVSVMGLLLTAIGVLVLRNFTSIDGRFSEMRNDATLTKSELKQDIAAARQEASSNVNAVWGELHTMNGRIDTLSALVAGRRKDDH